MRIALVVLSCVVVWTCPSDAGDLSEATSNVHRSQDDHGNYKFGYNIKDGWGSSNGRWEVGDALGNKRGGYTIADADGRKRYVEYVADKNGFRVVVNTNEPGTAPSKSGSALTKPVETADKHADENILQSLDHGGPEHLDSEPLSEASHLDSPTPDVASHSHKIESSSHLSHHHEPHHVIPSHVEHHPDHSGGPSYGLPDLGHQSIVDHHHGDPDTLASIGKPAFVNSHHENAIVAKKHKTVVLEGQPIITNAIGSAPKGNFFSSLGGPVSAAPIVHANYRPSTGISAHIKSKSFQHSHWSPKRQLYRNYLKQKYATPLYSSGYQSVLPRQITIEHPEPVDPKTLQSLLLSGTPPSFGTRKHLEYIPQYVKSDHSLSSPLIASGDALKSIQPPPVKIVQPATLVSHQPGALYSHLKSSTSLVHHEEAGHPVIELKTYRPHEGKAYPIHLKASESAGIPKYAKIIKRTGFGFRRYDEDESVQSSENASDDLHSVENRVRPSRKSLKSSDSGSSEEKRRSPLSKTTSRNIYSYY